MEERVLLEVDGSVAVLKINRLKTCNVLSKEIVDLIDDKLELLNYLITKGKEIRALIVTCDNDFVAGTDIADMAELPQEEARAFLFADTFSKLEKFRIPTIAAVGGYALGGGPELALACDLRIGPEGSNKKESEVWVKLFGS